MCPDGIEQWDEVYPKAADLAAGMLHALREVGGTGTATMLKVPFVCCEKLQ